MTIGVCDHDKLQPLGARATHPIEPRCGTLAVLLSQGTEALALARHKQSTGLFVSGLCLAGMSRSRLRALSAHRHRALPAHRITAHSGASNYRF